MADVSTLFVNGETYYIKDSTARAGLAEKQDSLTFDSAPTYGSTNPVTSSGVWLALADRQIWAGKSTTSAPTAAKTVTLFESTGFSSPIVTGAILIVFFQYGNSANDMTLNVNSTGAQDVFAYDRSTGGSTGSSLKTVGTGEAAFFVYNGTRWVMNPAGAGISAVFAKLSSPTFTGTPKAPTAAAGTNTDQIATTAFVQTAVQAAAGGAVAFQGVINSNTAISGLSSYTAGWYWVVGTAGTYVGQTCEVGDMIFCKANRGSAYSASDFNVVQVNVTGLGALAYKDSATGTVAPASKSITQLSSAGTMTSISSSYENEILSISWTNGQAPQGAAVSVADTQAVNVTVS